MKAKYISPELNVSEMLTMPMLQMNQGAGSQRPNVGQAKSLDGATFYDDGDWDDEANGATDNWYKTYKK